MPADMRDAVIPSLCCRGVIISPGRLSRTKTGNSRSILKQHGVKPVTATLTTAILYVKMSIHQLYTKKTNTLFTATQMTATMLHRQHNRKQQQQKNHNKCKMTFKKLDLNEQITRPSSVCLRFLIMPFTSLK